MPIYIDKPLAVSVKIANELLDLQSYPGQIFSCSALGYAEELVPDPSELASIGEIRSVIGFAPKDWDTYSIHIIEPILRFLPDDDEVVKLSRWQAYGRITLHLQFSSGVDVQITTLGDSSIPITFKLIGAMGCIDLQFSDAFQCFKNALQDFIVGIKDGRSRISSSKCFGLYPH